MSVEIKLPELGENIEAAQVTSVLVKAGDRLEKDQIILEIETDKAVIEVPSEIEGTIEQVFVSEGDKVNIGATLISVAQNSTSSAKEKLEQKVEVEKKKEEKFPENKNTGEKRMMELTIPDLGEGIDKADIIQVFVKVGDEISIDQAILEMETDKATLELPSEFNGKIVELFVKAGEKAEVGQVYMKIETTDSKRLEEVPELIPEVEEKPASTETATLPESKSTDSRPQKSGLYNMPGKIAPAAPTVRRFARQIGVDINEVPGSGSGGRISMDDVKEFSKALHQQYKETPQKMGAASFYHEALPDFTKFGTVRTEEMSNVRRKTAEHLSFAWSSVPMVTQFDKADITNLEKARKRFAKLAEEAGGKLTVTAILLKVVALALKKFPQFNASIDMENEQIIYKDYYNVGVAVDTDRGLIVPVLKNVNEKSIFELSAELGEIANKAKNRKIGLADLQGGNFTISNLGGLGGTSFTPIVNAPEVAILGVSRGSYEPRFENGEFVPRMMLPLSLTYDHRIIDGADAVRFIRWISSALEEPLIIAMDN